jgi:hypothetical protein
MRKQYARRRRRERSRAVAAVRKAKREEVWEETERPKFAKYHNACLNAYKTNKYDEVCVTKGKDIDCDGKTKLGEKKSFRLRRQCTAAVLFYSLVLLLGYKGSRVAAYKTVSEHQFVSESPTTVAAWMIDFENNNGQFILHSFTPFSMTALC